MSDGLREWVDPVVGDIGFQVPVAVSEYPAFTGFFLYAFFGQKLIEDICRRVQLQGDVLSMETGTMAYETIIHLTMSLRLR